MDRCERAILNFMRELVCKLRPRPSEAVAIEVEYFDDGRVLVRDLDRGRTYELRVPKECITLLINFMSMGPTLPLPKKEICLPRSRRRLKSPKYLNSKPC